MKLKSVIFIAEGNFHSVYVDGGDQQLMHIIQFTSPFDELTIATDVSI